MNGCTEMRNAVIFHSLDILNKSSATQATMVQLVEHANASRTVRGLSLLPPSFLSTPFLMNI